MPSNGLTQLTGQSEKHFILSLRLTISIKSGISPQFSNTRREHHDSSVSEYLLNCHGLEKKNTSKLFNDLSIQLNNEYANID